MRRLLSLCLTLVGFGMTFGFYLFKPSQSVACIDPELLCRQYILFRPDLTFDAYSHSYLIGERVFIAMAYMQIWTFDKGLSSFCCFLLFSLYILDYLLFFNDPIPGTSISFAMFMAGCFSLMILREFYILLHGDSRNI